MPPADAPPQRPVRDLHAPRSERLLRVHRSILPYRLVSQFKEVLQLPVRRRRVGNEVLEPHDDDVTPRDVAKQPSDLPAVPAYLSVAEVAPKDLVGSGRPAI